MNELLNQIISDPGQSILIILNLIVIESLLAIDNAAVLASMVLELPKEQRGAALRYGILGAYFFRGLCLLFASMLMQFWWLKPLGGLYLLYLVWRWWKGEQTTTPTDDINKPQSNWMYRKTIGLIGPFWATIVAIEIMDLTFSIDNVFAAVAFSDNIILIWIGVCRTRLCCTHGKISISGDQCLCGNRGTWRKTNAILIGTFCS
jgi:YkoY family integral membrane protein